jgi:hypothetical protein
MITTRPLGLVIFAVVVLAGCADHPPTPGRTTSSQSTATASTAGTFDVSGCPIADPTACAVAVRVATALSAGDADQITALSRATDFVCDESTDLPIPACTPGAVLTGHPLIDSQPVIEVLDDAAYAEHNATVLTDGAMQVTGVGTCGPDIPGRRSYHVAFAAAASSSSRPERLVGSYELNLLDGGWLIGTAFLDTYDAWLTAYQDPLRELGCNPAPWR